ncbi:MAG TPA: DUF4097 family beta strand repeat-containing protein [Bacteroidota bacterium]|jgi:DUF4097 and DUF4098 domain-containing protein YvlB|nr:DUF4097 family beta strand repeat-containing protein [Bacteroidota bacterium]
MNKSFSLTAKLTILVGFAVLFGATMIALSIKERRSESEDKFSRDNPDTIEKTFTVSSGDKLVIDADVGDINVVGNEGKELNIKVLQKGAEDQVKKYHVTFDQNGNVVTVRARYEKRYFHFFDDSWLDVRFEVQLPRNFNLDLQTSGGNVNLENVEGTILGGTSGGDVDVDNVAGTVKLSTSGGNVKMVKSTGELKFTTSGGNILGEDVAGDIHVETSGGNITFRRTDAVLYGETSGGDIRVELKGNKGIDLSTSGGNVIVNLPKTISGDVSAETSGGDVSCDFQFAGKLKEGSLHGKINGGGNMIRLESSGGDIVIHSVGSDLSRDADSVE